MRRVKLKSGVTFLVAGLVLAAVVMLGLTFFDYVRLSSHQNIASAHLNKLNRERAILELQNQALKEQVEYLKLSKSRVLAYERNLKVRLGMLRTEIESAASMALFAEPSNESKIENQAKDVGGAEVDCKGSACDSVGDDISKLIHQELVDRKGDDLLNTLDRYIDVLTSIPVGNPGNAFINSGFGMRVSPFSGTLRIHEGVDYALPIGTQVFSTGAGKIIEVKRHKTYGLMIDVEHSDRVVTRYAHLSGVSVKKGQMVCRGQAIGFVGTSGHSTGPHLHYEVRIDGKAQNPSKLIKLSERLSSVLSQGLSS